MSRAFVNEDATFEPEPRYSLPDPESPYFDEAAARALLEGANAGNTMSAEKATGLRWGEARLVPHVEALIREAEEAGDTRMARLGKRFLRKAAEVG
ncbi:MAG: hypothetical protein OEU54_06495 [Gemmatimonadota bacterium]|nr:hypothetical protein [Gemmatimonadota bacterium]